MLSISAFLGRRVFFKDFFPCICITYGYPKGNTKTYKANWNCKGTQSRRKPASESLVCGDDMYFPLGPAELEKNAFACIDGLSI